MRGVTMRYRALGQAGIRVSEIGFGCGNNAGLMVRGSYGEQLKAVARALELGINYFDTAAAYGEGRSEENLGKVLETLRAEAVVSTKVRLGPQALSNLKAATATSVEESLKRLKRERVDLIQLHNRVVSERKAGRLGLTPGEVFGEVLEGFKVLRDQGKVRYFGFSGLGDPAALRQLIDSGEFHSVQAYYNLLNPSAGQPVPPRFGALDYGRLIDHAGKRGMGVAVIRVLAAGALTDTPQAGGGRTAEPLSPGSDYALDLERARQLEFLVGGDVKSLTQAAIRFALMKAQVSTVIVGFSGADHVEEAASCSGAGGLSEEALKRLKELWESDFGKLKSLGGKKSDHL